MSTPALTDQHVVVLGGTSGIGLATAQAAAAEGAAVSVASSTATSVERALAQLPGGATGRVVDLTHVAATAAALAELTVQHGPIDHLVYTAGEPLALMPIAELDAERARGAFTLRYFGALGAVHAALPHLHHGCSITLTTGVAGDRPGAGWAVAASICGAVESLTRALAVELAPRGIRVNAISPGVVRSPLWASMSEADRERMYRDTASAIPLGRVGETRDIAKAFLFAMTEPFMTGSVITVDGGSVLA